MSGLVMRSKPQSRVILLLAIAFFIGMHIYGDPFGGQDSQKTGSQNATEKTAKTPNELSFDLGHGVKIELVLIPAGAFMVGDGKGRCRREAGPQSHDQQAFLHRQVRGDAGAMASGDGRAIRAISRAREIPSIASVGRLARRSLRSSTRSPPCASITFSLPTEAQWEYACRGGSSTEFGFGNDKSKLNEFVSSPSNADGTTHPVGQKKPNAWGLYDIHGNVWEWTADWYDGAAREVGRHRPAGPQRRLVAGASRRLVGRSRTVLPLVLPLLPPALVLRLRLRRTSDGHHRTSPSSPVLGNSGGNLVIFLTPA